MGSAMITKKQRVICLIIFVIYILIVLYITVFRFGFYYDERRLNLTLFTDLIKVFRNSGAGEFIRLFLGNIGWFVPFGFLLPMLIKRKNMIFIMVTGMTFSFLIEAMQYIFYKGVAELDDFILNTLGVAIGYLIYRLSQRGHSAPTERQSA